MTYYQKHKERYQNLSEEEKEKRRKKMREIYQNFTDEEKEKRRIKNLSDKQKLKLVDC